jgi:hypothetical protein
MRDNVATLRALLSDAFGAPVIGPEEVQARKAFQLYEFNTAPAPPLDMSPRAKAQREIMRIASWYGWGGEIERALDAAGEASMSGLSMRQMDQLLGRMVRLEHCIQEGCDPADAPPAR